MTQSQSSDDPQQSDAAALGALEGVRCLVLGGGGFIGVNLANKLAKLGASVHAYGRRVAVPGSLADGIAWTAAEFGDRPNLAAAVERADIVFHLLGSSTPSSANADPIADVTDNLIGTLHLFEICRACRVRRIVFVSSGGTVYGQPVHVPVPETAPTDPISAYGIQKLAVEKYLALYRHLHGIEYVVMRVANPYGPLQIARKGQGVVAALMRRALANEPIEIWGTGEVVRDFFYIDDLVSALCLAAVHAGPSQVFNVGSGVGISINGVIDAIERVVDRGPLERLHRESRAVDVPANVLDISRIRAEMGWAPRMSWQQGLRQTMAWMLDSNT